MSTLAYDLALETPSGQPLSAWGYLNAMQHNLATLDRLSQTMRRGRTEYMRQAIERFDATPTPLGWGSFQFQSGLTTLSIHVGLPATSTVQILLDGAMMVNQSYAAGAHIITVSLTGRGYTAYQVIDCTIQVIRPSQTTYGYRLYDAYVHPVSGIVGAAPSLPSAFALSLPRASLEALSDVADWQLDTLLTATRPALTGCLFLNMSNYVSTWLIWSGAISNANGANQLAITIEYRIATSTSERVDLQIGGTTVASSPTWGAGAAGTLTLTTSLSSYGNGSIVDIQLWQVITAVPSNAQVSWYSVVSVDARCTTPRDLTLIPTHQAGELCTINDVCDRLNSVRSQLQTISQRIANNPDMFDRIRLFMWPPGANRTYYTERRRWLALSHRTTDALWVKGRGLTLCWGARIIEAKDDAPYAPRWEHEQTITAGDAVETKLIAFDTLPGFDRGMRYAVIGNDLRFVMEAW